MAESPSHKFGQIIGDILETALHEPLQTIAKKHGLYLDYKHSREARGGKNKVSWKDKKGNTHDLDYVLEYGGNDSDIGQPKAFIEIAWRRYTKHSKNKAQEIQGAIGPLAETHSGCRPFLGAVLAGEFTEASLTQLRSHNFHVLYYPYDAIIKAFDTVGFDARFDEDSTDGALQQKVDHYSALKAPARSKIISALRAIKGKELAEFVESLESVLARKIATIRILPLHGSWLELSSVKAAINFINSFDETKPLPAFIRYEVDARYSNGDQIRGEFHDKATAVEFLKNIPC